MKRIAYTFIIFLLLTALGPLVVVLKNEVDFSSTDPAKMSRETAHLSPLPSQHSGAIVQVFAARTFNWRGPFSVHTWIAVKPEHAQHYTVYEVEGSRRFKDLPMVVIAEDIPDRYWYGNKPELLLTITGPKAQALIPEIDKAARHYVYAKEFSYWPGPNSNTFIATIAKQVPGLELALPGTAIGKDYLPWGQFISRAPSGTGYQISLGGIVGLTLAREEGLEINIIGLVYGISPYTLTVKWPGIGNITFSKLN